MFRYLRNVFTTIFQYMLPTNPSSLPMVKYPIPDHDPLFLLELDKPSNTLNTPLIAEKL